MVGTEAEQEAYRSKVRNSSSRPRWRALTVNDAETFMVLLDKYPEPMAIHIDSWTNISDG